MKECTILYIKIFSAYISKSKPELSTICEKTKLFSFMMRGVHVQNQYRRPKA